VRTALVTALAACAECNSRPGLLRFLAGLSWDELQYIAEFLGAAILDSAGFGAGSREQLAGSVAAFERSRTAGRRLCPAVARDHEHKMLVLLEYLCMAVLGNESLMV
jgi:hypothetical protein